MGYEHFWKLERQITRKEFRAIVKDFRIILPHLEVKRGLIVRTETNDNKRSYIRDHSILNDGLMFFNAEAQGEAFRLKREDAFWGLSGSCKTNNLPFDIAVNCALLIVKKHLRH